MSTLPSCHAVAGLDSPSRLARSLRRLANRLETRQLRRDVARRRTPTALTARRVESPDADTVELENARLVLLASGLLGPEPYWRGFGGRR